MIRRGCRPRRSPRKATMTTSELALGRLATRARDRAQRLSVAPREPRTPALFYLRGLRRLVREAERLTLRSIVPEVEAALAGQLATDPERIDVLDPRFEVRFGELAVALSALAEASIGLLDATALRIAEHNRREMNRVLRINLRRSDLGLEDFIEEFRARNVALIRTIPQQSLRQVEAVVERAVSGQIRVEALRGQIQERFNVSRSRAALIARDQTLKANANITQLRQQAVGVQDYIWTTSRDERVRDGHSDLDGTRQSWLVRPVVDDSGRTAHPGEDFQCRCTALPILPSGVVD